MTEQAITEAGQCFSAPPAPNNQEAIDAARYRWLRRQPWVKTKGIHAWGTLLDSAIDEVRHDAPNADVTGLAPRKDDK